MPRRVGRYLMFGPIASGGMATVHFGRLLSDGGFGRIVAIKRLREQFAASNEILTSFVDEARLVSRIQHPNVVPSLDVVTQDGEVFIVMEYVAGESLSRIASMTGSVAPLDITCSLMGGVLQGLQAAHEATSELGEPLGIVHRDVSPQNILVGRDGHPRLLDFGVAKARNRLSPATDSGIIKGKLAYMSPEQVADRGVDHRTDLFALGVVLWELLTGQRLFQGTNEAATILNVSSRQIPEASSLNPGIGQALSAVVRKALARDPLHRFQSAREFAYALEHASPFASAGRVSAWLDAVVGQSLKLRAGAVSEIERFGSGPTTQVREPRAEEGTGTSANLAGPAGKITRGSGARRWFAGVLVVVLAGVAGAWLATSRRLASRPLARSIVPPTGLFDVAQPSQSAEPTHPIVTPTVVAPETAPTASVSTSASATPSPILRAPASVRVTASAPVSTPAADCARVLGPDGIWRLSPPGCSR